MRPLVAVGGGDLAGGPGIWAPSSAWFAAVPLASRPPRSIASTGSKTGLSPPSTSSGAGQPTPLHVLQVADAEQHLAGLDPARWPRSAFPAALPYAVVALALALGPFALAAEPARFRPGRPSRSRSVLAAADEAEESLEDLQEAAKKENDPKLKELVQKLTETIQEMKLPGVDTKEALAKLSEMQAAITAQQAQFNVGLVDAQMQALGEAMASTQALEGAGQALQQGKYDKAAEQLEKAEPKFDRKETKTLKEKLAQAAKAMEDAGLADLSTATTELLESLDDAATAQGACKKLGNLASSQGRRKRINDLLTLQCQEPRRVQRQLPEEQHSQAAAAQEVGKAQQQLGHGHQRQHRRRPDQARLGPQARAGPGPDGRRGIGDRDDPHARRPADGRASLSRAVPEIPPHDRGRPQFRADSAGPPPDDPPLLRADPPPG